MPTTGFSSSLCHMLDELWNCTVQLVGNEVRRLSNAAASWKRGKWFFPILDFETVQFSGILLHSEYQILHHDCNIQRQRSFRTSGGCCKHVHRKLMVYFFSNTCTMPLTPVYTPSSLLRLFIRQPGEGSMANHNPC